MPVLPVSGAPARCCPGSDAHLSVETVPGVLSGAGPMRSRFCPVAANRHAAPTSCVGLAYVQTLVSNASIESPIDPKRRPKSPFRSRKPRCRRADVITRTRFTAAASFPSSRALGPWRGVRDIAGLSPVCQATRVGTRSESGNGSRPSRYFARMRTGSCDGLR